MLSPPSTQTWSSPLSHTWVIAVLLLLGASLSYLESFSRLASAFDDTSGDAAIVSRVGPHIQSDASSPLLRVGCFHNTLFNFETTLAVIAYLLALEEKDLSIHVTVWGPSITDKGPNALGYLLAHPHPRLTVVRRRAHDAVAVNVSALDVVVVTTHYSVNLPGKLDAGGDPAFQAFLELTPPRRVVYIAHRAALTARRIEAARNKTGRVLSVAPQGGRVGLPVWAPIRLLEPPLFEAYPAAESFPTALAPRSFVIQGSMRPGSRDMAGLATALRSPRLLALLEAGAIVIRIIGYNSSGASVHGELAGVPPSSLRFYHAVAEAEFHHVVRTSHFLLPLISPEIGSHAGYFRVKLTSSVAIACAYRLPMVIHTQLAGLYSLPRAARLAYNSSGGGGEGVAAASAISSPADCDVPSSDITACADGGTLEGALYTAATMTWGAYARARAAYDPFVRSVEAEGMGVLRAALGIGNPR